MFANLGPPEIGISCSFADCVELARRAGFGGLDIDIFEARGLVAEKGAAFLTDSLDAAGLKPGGWIWFDHFGFSDDDAAFQEQLDRLPSLAKVAQAIGLQRALSWILPYSEDLPYAANFERHRARLQAAADILNDFGQSLALEYIGPSTFREGHKHPFLHTMRGALELISAVDRPGVGLIMDSWHWYASGGTAAEILALPPELAVYVHLSDAPAGVPVDEQIDDQRCLPGTTQVVDNESFLQALQQLGYDGPVTAEPFNEEINALPATEAADVTAAALRELIAAATPT